MERYISVFGECRDKGWGPGFRRDGNAFRGSTEKGLKKGINVGAWFTCLSTERSRMTRGAAGQADRLVKMLLLAMAIIFAACKPAPVKEVVKVEAVKVTLVPVVEQQISLPVRSSGIVATGEEIRLSFKTGGIVARTYVREGDAVKQGQLLAALNLSEMDAQVNQAKNGFEKARRDYGRTRNLYIDSVATLEQEQNAETAMNVSKSVLDMARFNLAHSKITAPKSGIILRQLVRENELVAPGSPVFALGISGKNWVIRTSLSDRDIVKVNPGDSASVMIDAWPDQPFPAIVSQIGEASNPLTGTYEVELKLSETKNRLAYGFIANVELFPSRRDTYLLVPMASIVEADGRTGYVYTITPAGTARKIKVYIATLYGAQAAISGGLENVKEVVSEGVAYLTDDIPVDIRKQ